MRKMLMIVVMVMVMLVVVVVVMLVVMIVMMMRGFQEKQVISWASYSELRAMLSKAYVHSQ
jgi:hypothetical protein